ncbi:MAG: hypothetical protein Q8L89_02745 [Gammaproteobacteria bacterium]|nr:hypothetical protein [Gammaproteobacteria bacterium]
MMQHATGNTALQANDPHRRAWLLALALVMLAHSAVAYWLIAPATSTPASTTRTVDVMLMAAPPPVLSGELRQARTSYGTGAADRYHQAGVRHHPGITPGLP